MDLNFKQYKSLILPLLMGRAIYRLIFMFFPLQSRLLDR